MRGLVLITATAAALCLAGCSKKSVRESVSAASYTQSETLDTLTDIRDGRKYRTVVIGGMVWMAQNLNYPPQSGQSWCYDNNPSNCDKYGRLYNWETAKKVCPEGWRLPWPQDWEDLVEAAGGRFEASYKLRAQSGWADLFYNEDGDGTEMGNDDGFASMPGGLYLPESSEPFDGIGYFGFWWSASEDGGSAYSRSINCCGDDSFYELSHKSTESFGYSVRCLLDDKSMEWKEQRLREETRKNEIAARKKSEEEQKCMEEELLRKEAEERETMEERQERFGKTSAYFTDSRDGQKYRAVRIGENTWMAQNLNYKPENGNSRCYMDSASYCDKYGRLYDWETAMRACPTGWHLPSKKETADLMLAVGGKFKRYEHNHGYREAGAALKAKAGWDCHKGKNGNGTDAYGFSALPGGEYFNEFGDDFSGVGKIGAWWVADWHAFHDSECLYMANHDRVVMDLLCGEFSYLSVRCVADSP